ncbi:hypothetical protein PIB30_052666 [Stylosanthes scabra]|uniref:Protein FAR1-RELATED SEQUENCE n=1 Tax=Stylosanthes scabra TaxID=79078 RepID=A0ABU6QIX4_9FABA|nr:hypothetical protein [Stylosanthes scabra]
MNCTSKWNYCVEGIASYQVLEEASTKISNRYKVLYNSIIGEVNCECLLFESRGILCYHSLTILSNERVDKVDQRYILECWGKNVKRNHTNISSSYDEPVLGERTQRYNGALSRCFKACQVGSKSEGRTTIVHSDLDRIFSELQEYEEEEKKQAKEKGKTTISHEDCSLNEINDFQSPQHVRSRGRPRKRLGSNLEKKIANETKRKQRNTTDLH